MSAMWWSQSAPDRWDGPGVLRPAPLRARGNKRWPAKFVFSARSSRATGVDGCHSVPARVTYGYPSDPRATVRPAAEKRSNTS